MQTNTNALSKREPRLLADEAGHLVEVLGTSTADTVEFSAQGGGFVHKASRDEFEKRFKPAALPAFSLQAVSAEWLPDDLKLPAYTNGQRWNGWAMPYFPAEAAHALLEHMPDLRYDAAQDAFVSKSYDDETENDVFPAQELVVEGATVKVYAIGAGSWCWWLEA